MNQKQTENWLPVVGYEELYLVSDLGRVKSLDRINSLGRSYKGKVLSHIVGPHGYHTINVCRNGEQKPKLVHRLVLAAFVGPAPVGHQCCHKNDIKADNALANLRWDTPASNSADALRNGKKYVGEAHLGAKLCNVDIHLIRGLATSVTQRQIADWFGVHKNTIYKIVNRKSWTSC